MEGNPEQAVSRATMSKSKDTASKFDMTPLGESYQPTSFDVICARGRIAVNHTGNKRFKLIVESSLQRYSNAPSKLAKSAIVSDIVETIRQSSPGGGFVKKEGSMWYEAGDHLAREKVGQCLRDMLHSKYRSSTKAKKLSRKVKQSMLDDEVDQIMNRSSYRDITHRVKELTKDARKDSDFQDAFNRANLELLKTFKTEQIREEDEDDDDEASNINDGGDADDDDNSPQVVSSAL